MKLQEAMDLIEQDDPQAYVAEISEKLSAITDKLIRRSDILDAGNKLEANIRWHTMSGMNDDDILDAARYIPKLRRLKINTSAGVVSVTRISLIPNGNKNEGVRIRINLSKPRG